MKKVLSLVLAAVLVMGMGVVGFAAAGDPVQAFSDTNTLVAASANLTTSGFSNADLANLDETAAGAFRFWDGTNNVPIIASGQELIIPLTADMFAVSDGAAGAGGDAIEYPSSDFNASSLSRAFINASSNNSNLSVNIVGTNLVIKLPNSVDRRTTITGATVSMTIAPSAGYAASDLGNSNGITIATASGNVTLTMVLIPDPSTDPGESSTGGSSSRPGTSSTSSSTRYSFVNDSKWKVKEFANDYSLLYGYNQRRETGRYATIDLDDVRPADKQKEEIYLFSDMFLWSHDGGQNTTYDAGDYYLGSQIIRNSKISVRNAVAAGSRAIDGVNIKYKDSRAYVEVKFIEEYVSVNELDFEFTTYLVIDGKRKDADGQGLTFIGTLANNEILVYSNDDYVDLSLGEVAHAQDFVSDIEVDLGSGVYIYTKFFKDKKYYGTATRDADDAADVVFSQYPDVDNVVILKTVGLNSTGDVVRLDTDYSNYYVYDKDLNYLGQANERLPFSSRYYLANRRLDVQSDPGDDVEPIDDGDWVDPGADTGGDSSVSNANANPGTGR